MKIYGFHEASVIELLQTDKVVSLRLHVDFVDLPEGITQLLIRAAIKLL